MDSHGLPWHSFAVSRPNAAILRRCEPPRKGGHQPTGVDSLASTSVTPSPAHLSPVAVVGFTFSSTLIPLPAPWTGSVELRTG